MSQKKYTSVFDLEGSALESFMKKYGDIFEPRCVDLEYYKLYYLGKYDPSIHIFHYLRQTYDIERVVYPGSFIHLAPSYSFANVTYIDTYENIDDFFYQEDVKKYVDLHKIYDEETMMTFKAESYLSSTGQYDMMISSNGGSISIDCINLLKVGGLLLVNNGHNDADNAFENERYTYLGYFRFNGNHEKVTFVIDEKSKKSDTYYLFRLDK